MGSHLTWVGGAAFKHYSFPLVQIQTHSLCTLLSRKCSFDCQHPHFVSPSYFCPLFSKPALIVPSVEPHANRLSSLNRNLVPRDGFSRPQCVDVDVSLLQGCNKMSRQIVNELKCSFVSWTPRRDLTLVQACGPSC